MGSQPQAGYDLVVIGGGAAGLVAATAGAKMGARVAMIEKDKLGGDCTWYGCVPSKALLRSAQVFSLARRMGEFGISLAGNARLDPAGVMAHVREMAAKVSTHHPAGVFEERGIKVIFGQPRFLSPFEVEVGGERIRARRFIICTGSHPFIPQLDGLKDIPFLTNENVFDLKEVPGSLLVLGAGPIGMELAQAFSRLGTRVTVVEAGSRILPRDDAETAQVLRRALEKEGVTILTNTKAVRFSSQEGMVSAAVEDASQARTSLRAEKVLVAVGRRPNLQGLGLENAGVAYSEMRVNVDRYLRTTAAHIYACGDVAGPFQFSHMAEYQAVIAAGNALLPFRRKAEYGTVPWCTFTDPESAHVGLTEEEARAKFGKVRVYRAEYRGNDRAVTDLAETGMAKVVTDSRGYILGAHVVGVSAGELIHEYALAKANRIKVQGLSNTVHVYPTLAQVVKRSADQYYFSMLDSRGGQFLLWVVKRRKTLLRAAGAVLLLAGLWWLVSMEAFRNFSPAMVRDYVRSFGRMAGVVYVAAYALNTVSVMPPIGVVSLAAGFAFGKVWGAVYLLAGAMAGTSATFFLSRLFGRKFVEKRLQGRYKELDEELARKGFLAMLFFRIVPLVPYEALNYASGLSRIKFRDYFFGTLLGLIPGVVASAYFGASLGEIRGFRDIFAWKFLIAFGLLAVVVAIPLCYYLIKKRKSRGGKG